MITITATIEGTKPLIMSTQHGADPTNPLVRKLSLLTKKTSSNLTEEEHLEIKRLKFLLNLHWDESLGVVIPSVNLIKAVEEAARKDKKGSTVLRYVQTRSEAFPLRYSGPKSREELIKATNKEGESLFLDTRLANHGTKGQIRMVLETRPIFKNWGLEVAFDVEENEIDPQDFVKWLKRCGQYHGIGAYRQVYGRFEVEDGSITTKKIANA